MNERTPTPEELQKQSLEQQEREDDERWADYIKRHPVPVILKEDLREAGPEIAEFESMVSKFEAIHSLEKLNAIVDITPGLFDLFWHDRDLTQDQIESTIHNLAPEEVEKYKIIVAAKRDLAPIVAKLNTLQEKTNISADRYEELNEKYERLARAVGMINKTINPNKVDHER